MNSHSDMHDETPRSALSPGRIALAVFFAIALFFLLTEHRAHVYGVLPYLLVLACPLMHLFHHRGHGSHHGHGRGSRRHGVDGEDQ